LLKAAFPAQGVPDGTACADLEPAQRRALQVLTVDPRINRGAMISMLLGRFNLPRGGRIGRVVPLTSAVPPGRREPGAV
jgi:hypothetical protein